MLIDAEPDMEVVGEAASAFEVIEQAEKTQPDIVSLDLSMPGGDSLKAIPRLQQKSPNTRVLVLTMHDDPAYLRAAVAAGCAGYVVKTAADSELLTAIRAVAEGRLFIDLHMQGSSAQNLFTPIDAKSQSGLTPREQEVLRGLAGGHTNQAIADRLSLSIKTVETYRARIGEKLGLRTRADLVRYGIETGIIAPGSTG